MDSQPTATAIDMPTFVIAVAVLTVVVVFMFVLTIWNTPKNGTFTASGNSDDLLVQAMAVAAAGTAEVKTTSVAGQQPSGSQVEIKGPSRGASRVTRTILALGGFALFALFAILTFRLSGVGVAELRSTALGAIAAFATSVSAFYFATRAAQKD